MTLLDDAKALLMQWSAPFTVRYGEPLRFAGTDLPAPERLRVPTRHGPVRVDLYRPAGSDSVAPPVVVHFHGGAFVMRYPEMDDWWCRYLAATAGVAVANVDWSVAPQARYPRGQEEGHDVAEALATRGVEFGVDGGRLVVCGFSAGGNIAASVCLQARDRATFTPVLQVLGVPALDLASEVPEHSPGMLAPSMRRLVRRVYFPDVARRAEPYASPLLADDLSGLPPTIVMTGERDALRPDGDGYARRLREAGVEVTHDVTPGADHYFLTDDPARARRTMAMVADRVRRACGTAVP